MDKLRDPQRYVRTLALISRLALGSMALGYGAKATLESSEKHLLPSQVRELAYYMVTPYNYGIGNRNGSFINEFITLSSYERQKVLGDLEGKLSAWLAGTDHHVLHETITHKTESIFSPREIKNRLDAWRIYLGLPMKYDTFEVSGYSPTQSKEVGKTYFRIKTFFQNTHLPHLTDQDLPDNYSDLLRRIDKLFEQDNKPDPHLNTTALIQLVYEVCKTSGKSAVSFEDLGSGVMGNFRMGIGQDEGGFYMFYYDKWDLKGSVEGSAGIVGKPFEIYDRLYFDPETYKPLSPPARPGA